MGQPDTRCELDLQVVQEDGFAELETPDGKPPAKKRVAGAGMAGNYLPAWPWPTLPAPALSVDPAGREWTGGGRTMIM